MNELRPRRRGRTNFPWPVVRLDGEEHVFQYLESLDSVSAPWVGQGDQVHVSDRGLMRRNQIFLDILMTLAFGRDVAVPQPYAFDSGGFLEVAAMVLKARESVGADSDHPFRLHLFGADTFDQAVQGMLSRIGDPDRPFYSALLPKLNQAAQEGFKIPRTLDELLASQLIDVGPAQALDTVRRELGSLPRVPAHPRPNAPSLPELLANFAEGRSPVAQMIRSSTDEIVRSIHFDLLSSIQLLDPSHPAAFLQRSRLRIQEPWPNDKLQCLPQEIVGVANLQLVIEFVDTLYNAVVAESIGIAPVTYTTDVAVGDESLSRRAIAQELALIVCGARTPDPYLSMQETETEPLFVIRVDTQQALSNQHISATINRLADGTAASGLGALLEQRAARGRKASGKRSDFWTSLDKLNSAIADGDTKLARKSMDQHLTLVGRLLGSGTGSASTLPRVFNSGWQSLCGRCGRYDHALAYCATRSGRYRHCSRRRRCRGWGRADRIPAGR